MRTPVESLTVAAGQLVAAPIASADETLRRVLRLIDRAAEQRADLVVLPECAYPGYAIESVAAYRATGVKRPDEFVAILREQARRRRIHVVAGLIEDCGDALANAAVLIDADGHEVGRHRKSFLWNRDNEWFVPGDRIDAFDTDLGRVGMLICFEARCPEIVATLAARGAQLIAVPTCWINRATAEGQYANPHVEFITEARAREFGVPFACANKCGQESSGVGYCGCSRIVRADGSLAAEAPGADESLIVGRLPMRPPRKVWIPPLRRERLLSTADAVLPPAAPRTVALAALPGRAFAAATTDASGDALFQQLQSRGVQVLVTNVQYDVMAERVASAGRAFRVETVGFPHRSDVHEVGPAIGLRGFRVGLVGGQAIRSFATARALALSGAAALFVYDAPADLATLRTRALENRVYLVAVADAAAHVIGPDGNLLASADAAAPEPAVVSIDAAASANKAVAPGSDVFALRRPATFAF